MRTFSGFHCGNLSQDRSLGELWESNFCSLLYEGCSFVQHQKDRGSGAMFGVVDSCGVIRWSPSPDITVWWGKGITSHYEVKHKNATRSGFFGLEEYRVNGLREFMQRAGQDVHYTIHDHDCSGGRNGAINDISHWVTLSLDALCRDVHYKQLGPTYRNGQQAIEQTYYWHRSCFSLLEDEFDNLLYFAQREQPQGGD